MARRPPPQETSSRRSTKTQTINLRVGPRLKEAIEDAARENEMTVGEFVRTIMAQYLSVYEVGLRANN